MRKSWFLLFALLALVPAASATTTYYPATWTVGTATQACTDDSAPGNVTVTRPDDTNTSQEWDTSGCISLLLDQAGDWSLNWTSGTAGSWSNFTAYEDGFRIDWDQWLKIGFFGTLFVLSAWFGYPLVMVGSFLGLGSAFIDQEPFTLVTATIFSACGWFIHYIIFSRFFLRDIFRSLNEKLGR